MSVCTVCAHMRGHSAAKSAHSQMDSPQSTVKAIIGSLKKVK